jgi:hypothetical protein
MWKNIVETEQEMTSQYGAYALRAGLARLYARTHAHTDQYVILIVFPQQHWFREGTLPVLLATVRGLPTASVEVNHSMEAKIQPRK